MSTSTHAYLAPLSSDELAILCEKLHRAVVKTSVSAIVAYDSDTHVLVTEISDDAWDQRLGRMH